MRKGRKMNLTPLIEIGRQELKRQYCPHCLPIVEDSMEPHEKKLFYFGLKGSVK
jgi:hypothetical protein